MFESCRAHSYRRASFEGWSRRPPSGTIRGAAYHRSAAMRLDPNTHAFVPATAAIPSIAFTIFALNLLALVLHYALS